MSQDSAIALQPGQQEQNSISKEKKKAGFLYTTHSWVFKSTLMVGLFMGILDHCLKLLLMCLDEYHR